MQNKIALISFGYLTVDPRVLTMADSLKSDGYDVVCINVYYTVPENTDGCRLFSRHNCINLAIEEWELGSRYKSDCQTLTTEYPEDSTYTFYRYTENYTQHAASNPRFLELVEDVDIFYGCEMFWGAFIAYQAAKNQNKKFVFDLKELYSSMHGDFSPLVLAFIRKFEAKFIESSMVLPCVSQGIIDIYKTRYPASINKYSLLPNTPEIEPAARNSRMQGALIEDQLKFVMLSSYYPKIRGIEFLAQIWEQAKIEKGTLTLFLSGLSDTALQELKEIAKMTYGKTLFIENPVAEDDIVTTLTNFDIGIIPYLPLENENHKYCSPGKFGQYLKAGLLVLSSDTENITNYIYQEKLGYVYSTETLSEAVSMFQLVSEKRSQVLDIKTRARLFFESNYSWSHFHQPFAHMLNKSLLGSEKPLRVLMLHFFNTDKKDLIPKTVFHNLRAYGNYSKHDVSYFFLSTMSEEHMSVVDFNDFDCVAVHFYAQVYSVFPDHVLSKFKEYNGVKVFFAQDDYDFIARNRAKYLNASVDAIFSPVAEASVRDFLYPSESFGDVEFYTTLTGYAEDVSFGKDIDASKNREIDIFYRGNDVGWAYGTLGNEKQMIGLNVKDLASNRGLTLDIESGIEHQIYGDAYYDRMRMSKATLLTESGSSIVFSSDDHMEEKLEIITESRASTQSLKLADLVQKYPRFFEQEGKYVVATISPKAFEAISCKTALIAFEGEYSGVLKPDLHYIELKKDFSNMDEVINKLQDHKYLQNMVNRAHDDILKSGLYTYMSHVSIFDDAVALLSLKKK